MAISELEYKLMLERVAEKTGVQKHKQIKSADPEPESILMSKIESHCKQEGWPAQCFPPSQKLARFLTPGWPD